MRAEARSHNSSFRKRIVREIEKAFERSVKKVKNVQGERGSVEIEGFLDYDSFRLGMKEPCVRIAKSVIMSLGHDPISAIANGGLDANWITKHGIPTVSMGCGQLNAHMVTETLNLKEYLLACDIGLAIALGAEG